MTVDRLLHLGLVVGFLGLVFWLVDAYVPMKDPFKTIVRVIMIGVLIVILLNFLGIGIHL